MDNNINFYKIFRPTDLTIQVFEDNKIGGIRRPSIFAYRKTGVETYIWLQMGIYFVPNRQRDRNQRSIANTGQLKYISLDLDIAKEKDHLREYELADRKKILGEKLKQLPIPPNYVIETKNGLQPIWEFSNPKELKTIEERFAANEYYKQLILGFSAKTGLKSEGDSICRVLRLPGTYHNKNLKDTFLIEFVLYSDKKVTIEEFAEAYPPITNQNNLTLKRRVSDILEFGSEEGRRNMDLTAVTGSLLGTYHEDYWENTCLPILYAVNNQYFNPPLDDFEVEMIFDFIAKKEHSKRQALLVKLKKKL